jgi:hypothetical protein
MRQRSLPGAAFALVCLFSATVKEYEVVSSQ